ncbi:glycosyltransferase [Kamptonema cortianum]|uniref:Glycosyltransferase n=1 Tax=Geitlerinema calcuttense NRMC-F 0142 TaxID=2922238 RepID=A0ABT7LX52_9CYAN|nr:MULTISPECIES: glycosyltransferase [Cyanophyceae]MDK3156633.1 glycosyltransferase [Kamptonema cortianum]MDL5053372.1 glycosyltransferase [Oscillatoria laete-virens NRMC-F 0139]MDL5056591.1 glycosyltransferase [Geitlerinema calcuttense NRMC-F 0142]
MPQTVRVILPVYNEAAIAARVAAEVVAFARGMGNDWHFVFVDDGSTDGTAAILADSLAAEPTSRVKLLALGENYGKGQAIERGIEGATEDIIVFTDGDLAYSLDLIPEFVRGLLTHEIVIGSRDLAYAQARREGRALPPGAPALRRRIVGRAFNLLSRMVLGLGYPDTQAGIKAFRRDVAVDLFSARQVHGFGFDAEILFIAAKRGYTVTQIPVTVSANHNYKMSKVKILKDGVQTLLEVMLIFVNHLLGNYRTRRRRNS